jgi:anti-sigma factor RsiW
MSAKINNCRTYLQELSPYIDGELSEELCAELEQHLEGCQNCRVVVNTLRKTVELYHDGELVEDVPAAVRQRLYLSLNLRDSTK